MMVPMLVSGALRASAVLLFALVACAVMVRASAAARRSLLAVALGAAIVVPLAALVVPSWRVETPVALQAFAHESRLEGLAPAVESSEVTVHVAAQGAARPPSVVAVHLDARLALVATWLLGVLALGARAVASRLHVRRLARSGSRLDAGVAAEVRVCDAIDSPAVAGVFRSVVLLPRAAARWSAERLRIVLLHELAHARSRDALAQIVADVACALHWFNPLVWVVAARLRVERELAADDAVLAAGVRPSRYAEELLAVAGMPLHGALAMAERTTLAARVVAILASQRARGPLAARGTALLVAGSTAVGALAACASPQSSPASSASASSSSGVASATVAPGVPASAVQPPAAGDSTDPVAQAAAEETVAALATRWSADSAVVLVLDAATGEILADAGRMGSRSFDFARSRAISPGSTLKPIVIAAALETGAITSSQTFDCGPKPRSYGSGREIHDYAAHGALDAAHLLAVSSNIGTSHIFDALGGDRLDSWLTRFHFSDVPRVTTGSLEGAELSIGEGGLTSTPLQMAAAYGALASDGVYHAPTTSKQASPGERLVSSATASQVLAMLDTAVTDPKATGLRARVDGIHVAGKTGTADIAGPDGRQRTYSSFVGIADLPSHRVVALVGVETSGDGDVSGGTAAAPAFASMIRRLR
jgi:beta-lactamase regulating signal transducer with metallopeptidase domain